MGDCEDFERLLQHAPGRELQALLVRRVPLMAMLKSAPLDFLFTSGAAGRYNPRGVRCLYFAEDEATVAAEYQRHHARRRQPYATYFADVKLGRVLDLSQAVTLAAVGLRAADLHAPWVGARNPTATQCLGSAVSRQRESSAIRFPSVAARATGGQSCCVAIFPCAPATMAVNASRLSRNLAEAPFGSLGFTVPKAGLRLAATVIHES